MNMIKYILVPLTMIAIYGIVLLSCTDDDLTKALKEAKKAEKTYKENRMGGK